MMAANAALNRRNFMLAGGAAVLAATPLRSAFADLNRRSGDFSPTGLAKIPIALQRYIDDESAIGFVTLLYRRGEIAQVNTIGYQEREANLPMRRDTLFRLASMTKPITCVAALTLMEQGKIGLHESIDKWIPEFANPNVMNDPDGELSETHPASRSITLADLLTHRSGVAGMSARGALAQGMKGLRDDDPTADEWLKRISALPLAYDPGSHFNYGTSHEVLAALIERVSGQSFADYLKSTIFDPLDMKDTSFWLPKGKQSRLAAIYSRDTQTGKHTPASRPVPTSPRNFDRGSTGLISTVDDYLQFARMLLDEGRLNNIRILTHPSIALMTTNWLTPEQRRAGFVGNPDFWASQGFGLGVSITDDISRLGRNPYTSKGSFGWPGATGVWWRADPKEEMVSIFMVQNAIQLPTADVVARQAGNMDNPASKPATIAPANRQVPPVVTFSNLAYAAIDD